MSRLANLSASSVFLFLAVLLIANRIPLQGFLPPAYLVLGSVGVTFLIIWIIEGLKPGLVSLASLIFFFLILLAWAFGTKSFYPAGNDGYAYHVTAIWDLAAGWHPFFSPSDNIWVDSYPSGYWTLQSYIVATTGLIFAGQALLIGLMVFVGLQAYGFFIQQTFFKSQYIHIFAALVFAGLVIGNPVLLTQIQTHYVDAPLYIIGAAIIFFMLTDAFTSFRLARLGTACCIILLLNTKTSALYFGPLIIFGGFLMELVLKNKDATLFQNTFQWIKSKGILYALVGIFGIIVVGYKPYVTNILDHDKLLYPSTAKIMETNTPTNVQDPMSSPMKFIYGVFGRTEDNLYGVPLEAPIHLKIPGTFELSEFIAPNFDTRRGGFGPFFSLAFLTSILTYLVCRVAGRNKEQYSWRREGDAVAAFSFILLLSSAFFPESWWARYIPFVWLSCVLFALTVLFLDGRGKLLLFARATSIIALLSFIGCVLAGGLGGARQQYHTYKRAKPIDMMAEYSIVELYLNWDMRIFRDYQSPNQSDAVEVYAELLRQRGVNTTSRPIFIDIRCEKAGYFLGGVLWCIPKDAKKKSE